MNVSVKTAELFLHGEEEATSIVYKNYRALLYFIIATYVKVLSRRNEVSDPSSLHYYLCETAKNEAIDFVKKHFREQSCDVIEEICADKKETQLDYFLPYDLTKEEKKIVGYRLTFGLSWKEIGNLINIPVPTAKFRYVQAIKKIKGAYKR